MKSSRAPLVVLGALVVAITVTSTWWAGRQEAQVGQQVAALALPGDIHMLSSDDCGICTLARAWFRQHGVSYTECSIERDAACKADFEASRSPGTPVLLVRRQAMVGFNPERLLAVLRPRG